MGSEKPLVKPDDTAAKKAKNRRYEVAGQALESRPRSAAARRLPPRGAAC